MKKVMTVSGEEIERLIAERGAEELGDESVDDVLVKINIRDGQLVSASVTYESKD